MKYWRSILILSLLLALSACTARPAPTLAPTATAQPTPSATATQPPTATPTLPPDCGPATTIKDDTGRLQAQIPCGAAPDGTNFTLQSVPECFLPDNWRPVSDAFKLDTETGQPASLDNSAQPFHFMRPITLTFTYTDADLAHLDPSRLAVYYLPDEASTPQALRTILDPARHTATVNSQGLGLYGLGAQYYVPAGDRLDDTPRHHADALGVNVPPEKDLFDIAEDEDWFALQALAGISYTIQTRDLAPGVDTALTIADVQGMPLVTDDNSGGGKTSRLEWQPLQDGLYYIGVSCAPGSAYGCAARYTLEVTAPPTTLTLHNNGQIEYIDGDWDWFTYTRPSILLTPGWRYFRFNGHEIALKIGGGSIEETIAIICPPSGNDADEWLINPEKVEYLDNSWQPAYLSGDESGVDGWVCVAPGRHQELTVRATYQGATMEKAQDIIADPIINFQAGKVHSSSGACTHYYASGEWRPFENDMDLLPLTYTFRFNDGTLETEYTIAAGTQTDIH